MSRTVRWGIVSTGHIAGKFAAATRLVPDAKLLAVGSRARASADAFGDMHGIPRRYASYEALVADPDVDAICVATPHSSHRANTLLAGTGSPSRSSTPSIGSGRGRPRAT